VETLLPNICDYTSLQSIRGGIHGGIGGPGGGGGGGDPPPYDRMGMI
jgi:hypothetical protein